MKTQTIIKLMPCFLLSDSARLRDLSVSAFNRGFAALGKFVLMCGFFILAAFNFQKNIALCTPWLRIFQANRS